MLSAARKKSGNSGRKAAPLYPSLSADIVKQLKSIIATDVMIAIEKDDLDKKSQSSAIQNMYHGSSTSSDVSYVDVFLNGAKPFDNIWTECDDPTYGVINIIPELVHQQKGTLVMTKRNVTSELLKASTLTSSNAAKGSTLRTLGMETKKACKKLLSLLQEAVKDGIISKNGSEYEFASGKTESDLIAFLFWKYWIWEQINGATTDTPAGMGAATTTPAGTGVTTTTPAATPKKRKDGLAANERRVPWKNDIEPLPLEVEEAFGSVTVTDDQWELMSPKEKAQMITNIHLKLIGKVPRLYLPNEQAATYDIVGKDVVVKNLHGSLSDLLIDVARIRGFIYAKVDDDDDDDDDFEDESMDPTELFDVEDRSFPRNYIPRGFFYFWFRGPFADNAHRADFLQTTTAAVVIAKKDGRMAHRKGQKKRKADDCDYQRGNELNGRGFLPLGAKSQKEVAVIAQVRDQLCLQRFESEVGRKHISLDAEQKQMTYHLDMAKIYATMGDSAKVAEELALSKESSGKAAAIVVELNAMDMSKDSGGDKEEMTMFLTKASLFCNARKDTEKEKGVDETDKGADEEENGKANEE
jgi:hypothetical protein